MIELKIQCDCGQKYKFDVEPVDGQMPVTVTCPVCGADGTEKAKAILRQTAVPDSPAPPPPPAQKTSRIRVNVPSPNAPSVPAPPSATSLTVASTPAGRRGTSFAQEAEAEAKALTSSRPRFARGLLGGFLGAFIGTAIYFLIFKYTDFHFKLLAVGVGGLAGWGAEWMSGGGGRKELGVITALLTTGSIIAAQYFIAWGWWSKYCRNDPEIAAYANAVAEARLVVKAIPTGSDAEIRIYLASKTTANDSKPDAKAVTVEEIKQFRENNLPQYQDLAGGKITKDQYFELSGIVSARVQREEIGNEYTFEGVFLRLSRSKLNIISLMVAAGLAFRMSTNA